MLEFSRIRVSIDNPSLVQRFAVLITNFKLWLATKRFGNNPGKLEKAILKSLTKAVAAYNPKGINKMLSEKEQKPKLESPDQISKPKYKVPSMKLGPVKRGDGESFSAYKARMQREKQILRNRLRGFLVWSGFDYRDRDRLCKSFGKSYSRKQHGELRTMKVV